jgi:hypothetical protein
VQVTQCLSLYPGLTSLTINNYTLVPSRLAAPPPADTQLASTMQGLLEAAPTLTSLALTHTGLEEAAPAMLVRHRPRLTALHLQPSNQSLQECVPDICRLTCLTSLTLDGKAGGSGDSQFPAGLEALRSLCNLHLPKTVVGNTEALDTLLAATRLTALTVSA